MFKKLSISVVVNALLLWVIVQFNIAAAGPFGLPPGFAIDEVASGFNPSAAMLVLPNGDIWVMNKGIGEAVDAHIQLIENGRVRQTPILTLNVNGTLDSGMLALVRAPDFGTSGHFYVYYAPGPNALAYAGETVLRLSRFTYNPTTKTADPESETIIINDIPWAQSHQGNSLLFDTDGHLLLGLGERDMPATSQDGSDPWRGKIVRITPIAGGGYQIPADNPFVNDPDIADEVYALGVRNPFRLVQRDSDQTIFLGDVGSDFWEEVNLLSPGANYGWPIREGFCNGFRFEPCDPTPDQFTDPQLAYRHEVELGQGASGAITGIDFYTGDAFPAEYHDKLFFADFNQNMIAVADVDLPAGEAFDLFASNYGVWSVVDIVSADNGLYLLHFLAGKIYFISYQIDATNQVPVADFLVDTGHVPTGTAITFDAGRSYDPDGVSLTFDWDFGDGITTTTPALTTTHTYSAEGNYEVQLTVTDRFGATSLAATEVVYVYNGQFPSVALTIVDDPDRSLFHGGERLRFEAIVDDSGDLDATTPYSWRIDQHHNDHVHPMLDGMQVLSGTFSVPAENHGGASNIWYRFYLTMRLDTGRDIVVYDEIYPQHTELTIGTVPADFEIEVNGGMQNTPHKLTAITA